ncbi:MAG: quinolinate synthase NadA [Dehalococcoidales bacterium]|nr:quinolinate synthase NadA [Dehalococcoidales bacterium]
MDNNTEIIEKIETLKKSRNAILLVHNYQLGEVQDIADYSGDSLELSRKAAETDADVIVFCGVHFMAETAAILNPGKTVLLPNLHSGCPMADMVTASQLRKLKAEHPKAKVVCYVNSTAEVKAESDICCTSANAVKVVESLKDAEEIIFVPDRYLGSYAAEQTGKELILWPGYCPTHARIRPRDIMERKVEHPRAKVVVHPECREETKAVADAILSTGGMVRYVRETDAPEIIVGTEIGIIHRLKKENPDKVYVPVTEQAICPNMKMIDLETVLDSLENMQYRITVPEEIRVKAKDAVDRMLELS